MELINLKNQLSAEWQKPKKDRNYELISNLHDQIKQEKTVLKKGFRDRQKEKLTESVKQKQVMDAKKIAQYKKIRAEKSDKLAKTKASEAAKTVKATSKKKK